MTAPAASSTDAPDVDPDGLGAEGVVADDKIDDDNPEGADKLEDAGKKALDAMKSKWRTERDRAKQLEQQLADAKKPAKADDDKPDLDEIRKTTRAEVQAEALRDRVLDKIEARAARLFKDPEDALLRLGKSVDDYIDDGKIDVDAINDALEDLLKKRPDFGVTQGEPKRFQGTADGGARGSAGKPQLTESDVKKLSKEGKHAEIEQARTEGRLNKLLGIT